MKIVLLGERGVGKTSTLYRFTRNEFRSECDPTTKDIFEKAMKIDDTIVIFQIENAYGYQEFPVHRFSQKVLFFVFAMNDISTFTAIEKHHKQHAESGNHNGNDI